LPSSTTINGKLVYETLISLNHWLVVIGVSYEQQLSAAVLPVYS
jgi:hypothetical protein